MRAIFLSVCLMITTLFAVANPSGNGDPNESLTLQLSEIINKSTIWENIESGTKILMSFTINSDGEIVILSTDSPSLDTAIKDILNYKKVNVNENFQNEIFHLPISIQKGN